MSADGKVSIDIDLTSVETYIDIRNERMKEHVFKGLATANLSAEIDMEELTELAAGESTVVDAEGVLSLLGTDVEIEAEMFVMRVTDTQVMVATNDMIWLGTEDAGITAGIDKLQELAKLPSITRTAPVTMRLMFNLDEQKAEAAPAAPVPLSGVVLTAADLEGDAKAGKKVFRKCKACHSVKEGKNGAGPSLFGILGANAGQVEGFAYSSEMVASGLVWDVETLTSFLAKPKDIVPGTSMAFAGLKKEAEIADVIAYIAQP